MRNYRVSGRIDGEFAQVDVTANNKTEAKNMAIQDHDFEHVINVSEL